MTLKIELVFMLIIIYILMFLPWAKKSSSTPNSKKLNRRSIAKLAAHYWGSCTVLHHIGSSAYCLDLLEGVSIHLVFHVSHLKELMGSNKNIVTIRCPV